MNTVEVRYPVIFKTSDGKLYEVDWRDVDEVFRRDPEGHTISSPDPNVLLLTAEDWVWLWSLGMSA